MTSNNEPSSYIQSYSSNPQTDEFNEKGSPLNDLETTFENTAGSASYEVKMNQVSTSTPQSVRNSLYDVTNIISDVSRQMMHSSTSGYGSSTVMSDSTNHSTPSYRKTKSSIAKLCQSKEKELESNMFETSYMKNSALPASHEVFYDPDLGLFTLGDVNNNKIVFNNCSFTVQVSSDVGKK